MSDSLDPYRMYDYVNYPRPAGDGDGDGDDHAEPAPQATDAMHPEAASVSAPEPKPKRIHVQLACLFCKGMSIVPAQRSPILSMVQAGR